ncbi:hypothetical protein GCM10009845_22990 [Pedococcus bigeumensis]
MADALLHATIKAASTRRFPMPEDKKQRDEFSKRNDGQVKPPKFIAPQPSPPKPAQEKKD